MSMHHNVFHPSPVVHRIGPGILAILLLLACLCRAADTAKLVPALGWDVKKQGGFPVSLASDHAGNIWVGTEGNGVWRYNPGKKEWTQFTTKNGLGDDCVYALAVDGMNRVWAGQLNHGVSVYNGDKWRNYGLIDGPIGDRVFAIAVSPKDGDVWTATDMGLARYSEKRQDWDYYTRASGLPSDQVQCITFDENGQIYAGTQCEGVAIAGPDDDYTKWRAVAGPAEIPESVTGEGLCSGLVNVIESIPNVSDNASSLIAALTPFGVSLSPDGDRWFFIRGQDWRNNTPKSNGGAGGLVVLPPAPLPTEDWMTALQYLGKDAWLGYRKSGVESRDMSSQGIVELQANVEGPAMIMVRAILTLPDEPPLIAAYDGTAGGLLTPDNAAPFKAATSGTGAGSAPPPLPAAAPVPMLDDAKALSVRLGKLTLQIARGEAFFLADDWRTQGDWIGRYGSGYAKLCGIGQNGDQDYSLQPGYEVSLQLGPRHEATPTAPVWYHDNDRSDDLRSLYEPMLGHRRDAEDNDGSYDTYTYPESYDGPDLWAKVKVPEGVHCLSLYFVNNDAHNRSLDKYRDYDVSVLSYDPDITYTQSVKALVRTRVTDFWGGVYKQFLVRGPASYMVKIGRNRSFVTRLQAVFLDRVTGDLPDNPGLLPGFDTTPYEPPDEPDDYHPTPLTDAAVNLWTQLDDALGLRGAVAMQMPLRIWCYRAAIAGQAPAAILERWRWQISIWTPDDRKKFEDAVKAAHDAAK